jgi:hypothetical protein
MMHRGYRNAELALSSSRKMIDTFLGVRRKPAPFRAPRCGSCSWTEWLTLDSPSVFRCFRSLRSDPNKPAVGMSIKKTRTGEKRCTPICAAGRARTARCAQWRDFTAQSPQERPELLASYHLALAVPPFPAQAQRYTRS